MATQWTYERLGPADISAGLDQIGVDPREFCRFCGIDPRTFARWLLPVEDPQHMDPPFWLTIALSLMTLPDGVSLARSLADRYAIR